MKMRKIIAMLLALVMVCSIIPMAVFAEGETTATITFDDTAKRTEFTTSKQVWVENGITVTNDKAASSSNVADYKKPARFYAASALKIEYPGMTKLVVNCNSTSYATALVNSIPAADGVTVTVNSKAVTIELAEAADEFVIAKLSAQVRVDSITVTAPAAEPEVPAGPTEGTITFDDTAKRVEFDTTKQVWTENEVTVTNEKAASSNNVADYSKPARFYAASSLKIEFPGMTKLVVNCNSTSYATALVNSIPAADGVTVTVNSKAVTIELAEAANEFVIAKLSAQVRVDSMTAYAGAASTPETPEEPEIPVTPADPTPDTELTIKEALALGASKEHNVYTEGKYYVTGVITEVYNTTYGNMKITDAEGNILTIYGTYSADGSARYDAMDVKPVAGDTVKIYGIVGQYNGTPQIKNGWIVEHTPATTPEDPTPEQPEEPETPAYGVVDAPVAGTAYKFGMIQGNVSATDVYYLVGGMNGYYMATGTDAAAAIDVYLEETTGGYYMYTMVDGVKTYINMVVSADGAHVNGAYEAAASTVYTYNTEKKTVIATIDGVDYWFGTRSDKSYTTVGPCAVSLEGFYCQFYTVAASETPEQPEQPEEPKVPETLAEQIAEANKLANGAYLPYESTITGTIIDEPVASSRTEGQYKFTVSDGTNTILCYYTPVADGVVPAKGDTATVVGKLTAYNGSAQFDETAIAVVVNNTNDQPGTGDELPETAGISIVAMAALCALSGSALVLLKKKEF